MRPQSDEDRSRLWSRVLAAAVMIPIALAAAWVSPLTLAVLTTLAGLAMALEWSRLVSEGAVWPFWFCGAAVLASQLVLALGRPDWAWGAVVAAAVAGAVAARAQDRLTSPVFLGITIIAGASLGLVWLRGLPFYGLETVLWLFAVVWATDSMAFATGTTLGGPRLAPAISPRKTWSGAIGGVAAAGAASVAFGQLLSAPSVGWILALGVAASIASQCGDLVESWLKRQYGVKDMSSFIPGHGGVLDRLDGLIAATSFTCLLTIWGGKSPLLWG